MLNFNIEDAKRAYNWFHHTFPDYKNNPLCTKEDIELRDRLEEWLIGRGQ